MARNADDWGNNPYAAPGSDLDNELNDPDLYPEDQGGTLVYAGFWPRFGAALVDFILYQVLATIIGGVLGGVYGGIKGALNGSLDLDDILFLSLVSYAIRILVSWLYCALQESSEAQATVGKKLLGIKVTDLNGARITFGQATGRHFGKYLSSFFLIGYLIQPFTEKKQALHDMMAGTLVVKK